MHTENIGFSIGISFLALVCSLNYILIQGAIWKLTWFIKHSQNIVLYRCQWLYDANEKTIKL